MPIYEIGDTGIRPITETTFAEAGIQERKHLQMLLRSSIDVVSPDTLVIAEEFGEWEDSKRRIDLLGIDKQANLVVIGLKRTDDGGHMELQAIRYAAMVSGMTFDRAVDVYEKYLKSSGKEVDARSKMLHFLDWDEPNEQDFAQDTRIVLAAADFSREITTSVLWLNEYGLDIRCVRLKPYKFGNKVLADVSQVVPLPEASEYTVRLKEKYERERSERNAKKDFTKFEVSIDDHASGDLPKRRAIFVIVKALCDSGVAPEQIVKVIGKRPGMLFRSIAGDHNSATFLAQIGPLKDKKFESHRYFCNDDELIHFDGKTYAFTNQWGRSFGDAMKMLCEKFQNRKISCKAIGSI
jgi:hypothetical protein